MLILPHKYRQFVTFPSALFSSPRPPARSMLRNHLFSHSPHIHIPSCYTFARVLHTLYTLLMYPIYHMWHAHMYSQSTKRAIFALFIVATAFIDFNLTALLFNSMHVCGGWQRGGGRGKKRARSYFICKRLQKETRALFSLFPHPHFCEDKCKS